MRRLCLLPVVLLLLCACGRGSSAPSSPDVLQGGNAKEEVKSAQAFMRVLGHFHFHDSVEQESTGSNIGGVPEALARSFDAQISLTADGDVAGSRQVSATAFVVGVPDPIHLVENGCVGYDSTDGSSWFRGEQPRWLTLMVSPNMDDGLTTLEWRDLGATERNNVPVHHLHAAVTALGLSGAAPKPGATPPPGFNVSGSSADLWLRSSDGKPVEADLEVHSSADLHALAAGSPYAATATGTTTQHLTVQEQFSSARGGVTAPTAATLQSDPVPDSVYSGFGSFGVQRDSCPGGGA